MATMHRKRTFVAFVKSEYAPHAMIHSKRQLVAVKTYQIKRIYMKRLNLKANNLKINVERETLKLLLKTIVAITFEEFNKTGLAFIVFFHLGDTLSGSYSLQFVLRQTLFFSQQFDKIMNGRVSTPHPNLESSMPSIYRILGFLFSIFGVFELTQRKIGSCRSPCVLGGWFQPKIDSK